MNDIPQADFERYYEVADFSFNYNTFMNHLTAPVTAGQLLDEVTVWLDKLPQGKPANWVVSSKSNVHINQKFRNESN